MPENDTALLLKVAHQAGEIALGYFNANPKVWEKSDDAGPVTEADLAVNEMFTDQLRTARPDYGWLSEETEDSTERLTTKRQFVLDPIDGTRAFISGNKHWGHSLAVVEDGITIAAVVHMPVIERTYNATIGSGAFVNGTPIRVADSKSLADSDILCGKQNLDPKLWKNDQRPDFKVSFRSSLAYRMALVAEGQFDAMLSLHPVWEWDIAAGTLIVQEAGGRVCDKHGKPLKFNNEVPQVAGIIAGGSAVMPIKNALSSLVTTAN